MNSEVPIRLVLVDPPPAIDYGVQHGRGARYETMFVQQRKRRDVSFDFSLTVADTRKNGLPNFRGPFAQGPSTKRFVYIDVGTYAGQEGTHWARRMIVPLHGITWALIKNVLSKRGQRLLARIPGTGKDGGPNCATVQLLGDWQVIKDHRGDLRCGLIPLMSFGDRVVVRKAGRYSSEDIHRVLFSKTPARRTVKEIKDGIRRDIKKRHAGH